MANVHVEAKRDFLESLTTTKPLMAVAELIWNGFDAGAEKVQVKVDRNELGGLEVIRVRDSGQGMEHSSIDKYFGNLGDSWKKRTPRKNGRALHGKNGKGRFKAFALGEKVEWYTYFNDDGKVYSYKITGHSSTLEDFEVTDPILTDGAGTGTEVSINNLKKDYSSLQGDSANVQLARVFALYLTEYPHLRLEYDGIRIEPDAAINHYQEYQLPRIDLDEGKYINAVVTIIEWNIPTDRVVNLPFLVPR